MKTSELIGPALDWAVAKCEKIDAELGFDQNSQTWWIFALNSKNTSYDDYAPSTDWSQGGPIIEREEICLAPLRASYSVTTLYSGVDNTFAQNEPSFDGPTTLIAAMRCYVASKLGNEVDVPKELM